MLISSKYIHFFYNTIIKNSNFEIKNKLSYILMNPNLIFNKTFILNNFLFKVFTLKKPCNLYFNSYFFKLKLRNKYLFLLSNYIIYSKLNNLINCFFFKFSVINKKKKQFTILRAPCNHKNSKEQFAFITHVAKIQGRTLYKNNIFYNQFFLSFFKHQRIKGLTDLFFKYEKQKNAS